MTTQTKQLKDSEQYAREELIRYRNEKDGIRTDPKEWTIINISQEVNWYEIYKHEAQRRSWDRRPIWYNHRSHKDGFRI